MSIQFGNQTFLLVIFYNSYHFICRESYSSVFPISLYSFIFTTHLQNSTTRRVNLWL